MGQRVAGYKHFRSEKVQEQRFKVELEVPIYIATVVWEMLKDSAFLQENNPGQQPLNPSHMLWALMFLKKYSRVESLANTVEVDEKTFRKWAWLYLEALAELDSELVSVTT